MWRLYVSILLFFLTPGPFLFKLFITLSPFFGDIMKEVVQHQQENRGASHWGYHESAHQAETLWGGIGVFVGLLATILVIINL